jgi:hypothetical protein
MNILGLTANMQRERPIFLLASGHRCGSTLLQRLLNSSPDILIWGEQKGYLNQYIPIYRNLQQWERQVAGHRKTFLTEGYNNFIANMLPEDYELREAVILHLYALFGIPATRLGRSAWGFKEVRYGVDVALSLQECFPKARFIHLIRDISACFLSMKRWEQSERDEWKREWTLRSLDNWEQINQSFLERGTQLQQLLTVRFEDMTADPRQFIEQLADFLEVPASVFDQGVFKDKIRTVGKRVLSQMLTAPSITVTEEERALLTTPGRLHLLNAYNY